MKPIANLEFPSTAASRSALFHGVYLTVIGNPLVLALLSTMDTPRLLTAAILTHIAVGLGVGIWLAFHRELKPATVNLVDALLILPYFGTVWLSQWLGPASIDWLFAPKLLAFGWAIVVPGSYRLHAIFIVALGIESLLMWNHAVSLGVVSEAEPWFTVLTFWMALSLLVMRQRQRRFENEVVQLKTRNEVLTEIAVVFLRVRDLANTPLQTLSLSADMLEHGKPANEENISAIKRAIARLHALFQDFRRYEDQVRWDDALLNFAPAKEETDSDGTPGDNSQTGKS